ncbi:MAG: VCBS repeat-containing protein [Sandaracinaceae bacterium]|nr:MAG: VCBS repeat-containing protein [Sandaracinaceae bacterium]
MGRRPLHPSRRLALASLSLWVAVSAAACASERAARVELVPERSGDGMCVWAFGDGEQVFQQRYPTDRGALLPPSGSLTFVAGARVSEEVVIGARVLRGGAIVGERRARIPLADALTERTLRVARCAPFDPEGPLPLEASGRIGAGDVARVVAGDADGDGRDELLGVAGDGSIHVFGHGAESRIVASVSPGARLATLADLDGDCTIDGVVVGDDETRTVDAVAVAPTPSGALPPARDAVAGSPTGVAALARVDAEGLSIAPLGGGVARTVAGTFDRVRVEDFDGDGRDDVVASGAAGTRFFLGGDGALDERPDALPAAAASATGPMAALDADGDGAVDLVTSLGDEARLSVNRGDGLLELRGGPLAIAVDIAIVATGDVDGDCADEIILIGADGSVAVASLRDGALVPYVESWPTSVDAAVGDFDGDGLRELALTTPEGEVWLWRP